MDGLRAAFCFLMVGVTTATEPVFEQLPRIRKPADDSVHQEVMSYSVERPFGNAHGRPTNVHETVHGIHATYRNKAFTEGRRRTNCLYVGDGLVAYVKEPDFLIRNVQRHVPPSLRGYRYPLYFVTQLRDWDDSPLYIFDEWSAYIAGGESAVDDHKRGITDECDAVSGCLEFSIYAVAVYLTAKERTPDYADWNQLRGVLAHNLTRAEAAFDAGRNVFRNTKQDRMHRNLQTCDDAEPIRKVLREEFGGAFLD